LYYGFYGSEFIKNECFIKINNIDLLHDFFSTCEEYQLDILKKFAQDYFSCNENLKMIIGTENNNTSSLITTVVMFNLENIKKTYQNNIIKKIIDIKSINFNNVDSESLCTFFKESWELLIPAIVSWAKNRDPTDEEVIELRINYYNCDPKSHEEALIRCIRKFTKANKFKLTVLEK
jgi:ferredoxin-fold anticodon binding domain-containing protein